MGDRLTTGLVISPKGYWEAFSEAFHLPDWDSRETLRDRSGPLISPVLGILESRDKGLEYHPTYALRNCHQTACKLRRGSISLQKTVSSNRRTEAIYASLAERPITVHYEDRRKLRPSRPTLKCASPPGSHREIS